MNIVVDANVVKGLYEIVRGGTHSLTHSPENIFSSPYRLFLDAGGQIENEWETQIDPEWYRAWFIALLDSGVVLKISVKNYPDLCRDLHNLGFPRCRDIWYARTAKEVHGYTGVATIVTEDIDFYDPTKKDCGAGTRQAVIRDRNSPIRRYLRKDHDIEVNCVACFLGV